MSESRSSHPPSIDRRNKKSGGTVRLLCWVLIFPILLSFGLYTAYYFLIIAPSTPLLDSAPSYSSLRSHYTLIQPTSRGLIEHLSVGKGPVVLVLHGSPGGIDQSLSFISSVFSTPSQSGFQYLIVSRPGYGNSSLSININNTPNLQVELMYNLLEELDIDKVAIIGLGGTGNHVADIFAKKHPSRIWGLITIGDSNGSNVIGEWSLYTWPFVYIWDLLFSYLNFFRPIVSTLVKVDSNENTDEWNAVTSWIAGSVGHFSEIGYANDVQFGDMEKPAEKGSAAASAQGRKTKVHIENGVLGALKRKGEIVKHLERRSDYLVW